MENFNNRNVVINGNSTETNKLLFEVTKLYFYTKFIKPPAKSI